MLRSPSTPSVSFEQQLKEQLADIIEPEDGQKPHVYIAALRKADLIMGHLRSKGVINNG